MSATPVSEAVLRSAARSASAARRIKSTIIRTPVIRSRQDQSGHPGLYFKADNLQATGSFKFRGATAKLSSLPTDVPLITASSGNHGIACSRAAQSTGHNLTVVLPETVPEEKLRAVESYGTKVIVQGAESGASEAHAQKLAASGAYTYVSPYNDLEVVAGQGTIGIELLEQLPHIDNVFISMGGGGLISGIGSVLKTHSPATRIIGVSAANSAALAASMVAGEIVKTEHHDTLADGVAGGVDDGSVTLPLAMEVVDEVVHCSEAEIEDALNMLVWDEKQIVEGAAALALAGYLSGAKQYESQVSVVLLCGANFDRKRLLSVIGR